ncbi:vacuolar protein sorting-associated protein 68 [[Candida] anglica]|uniref:Vacuolar protein sorting-associated protein 68 n=1 Tax=[Candida] anglica TaxID=148631 RepID=A0ABP0EFP5_9ASCO
MDQRSGLFRFNLAGLGLPKSQKLRSFGVYLSGILFAIGFWSMIDAAIYSKTVNASVVHVTFVDWIPFICSTLGMIIVNSIEKTHLLNDNNNSSFLGGGDSSTAWKARVILFFGFSLLAGGLAGSFMVFIIKFLLKHYTFPTLGMGVSNIVCNGSIMLSCIVLWLSQNIEDEYSYSLAL